MGRSGTDRRFARLAAELLPQRLRPGGAEAAFPRVADPRPLASMLAGGTQDLPPPPQGRARGHPDGSVSFGGAFVLSAGVGATRAGAVGPLAVAAQELAAGIGRLGHSNALAALRVPGGHRGPLDPEGGDAAGALGDHADGHYARHGVFPDAVVCDRPAARRILAAAGEPVGRAGAQVGSGQPTLPGRDDIKMLMVPGMGDVLQLMDRRATLQCTDGGIMVGARTTPTGHDVVAAGYREFGTMNGSAKGSMSGATWSIAPADSSTVPPDQEDRPVCERPWLVKTLRRLEHMALNNGLNAALSRLALESQDYVQARLAGS